MNVYEAQVLEIYKHKWCESKKVGHDVGIQWAASDWIMKYAKIFRTNWIRKQKRALK